LCENPDTIFHLFSSCPLLYLPQTMDHYWEQLVENILGGAIAAASTKTIATASTKTAVMTLKQVKQSEVKESTGVAKKSTFSNPENVEAKSKGRGGRKKSRTEDDASNAMKNLSLTSDDGIDISYTPLSASITSIPKVIMRPQHPLATSWTFWYSVGNKNLSWEQNQVKISTVSTIEQFWFVTSQLRLPSNIPTGHTYSVFRGGVLPDWEDVANVEGGRWMITCSKVEKVDRLDSRWREVLFMMVGEHMGESSREVNGAEACVRKKGDRLEVWVKNVSMMKDVLDIGRKIKNKLGLDTSRKIKFALHKEDKEGVKGPRLAL